MQKNKIIVTGGGTAGWMAAMILTRSLPQDLFEIVLIESPDIPSIGVGEGSTPALKIFFDALDISEHEWMPACNATYKCGIRFEGWSTKPGYESYFHPFSSQLDEITLPKFIHNAQARIRGVNLLAHPDQFFLANYLAKANRAPKSKLDFPEKILYGYHFDAALLGSFLRAKAKKFGVTYYSSHIEEVHQDQSGDIIAVVGREGTVFTGDFFVDCTGFKSLLLQHTLGVRFKSFSNNLYNDSAVAIATEANEFIPSETVSTAMKSGWAWKIPLTNRYGNGYVYSSDFCSSDQAEFELREHLGLLDSDVSAKHIKMKVGQADLHWYRNCLAVGLSQGFIEPLEATALYLVQKTVVSFVDYFLKGECSRKFQPEFNNEINNHFEGVRDYIVTHYKTSSRNDTEYWRANTANPRDVSETMLQLYQAWFSGENLTAAVLRLGIKHYYSAPSWYCIFAGMSMWGNGNRLRKPGIEDLKVNLVELKKFITVNASKFEDHKIYLHQFHK